MPARHVAFRGRAMNGNDCAFPHQARRYEGRVLLYLLVSCLRRCGAVVRSCVRAGVEGLSPAGGRGFRHQKETCGVGRMSSWLRLAADVDSTPAEPVLDAGHPA